MPSLKDIRRRIKTVKSTQKITQAMYMIATTKLKKAEMRVYKSRPFYYQLLNTVSRLTKENIDLTKFGQSASAIHNFPALMENREIKTEGLLVIASNKGLSGPYNTNVVKETLEYAQQLNDKGKKLKVLVIGLRAYNSLKRSSLVEIVKNYTNLNEVISPGETSVIAENIAELYVNKEIDKISIITTKYNSKVSNYPEIIPLLPVNLKEEDDLEKHPEMIFEPSPEAVLQQVFPLYISNTIFTTIIEALASELASRMSSMKNATENADEMLSMLTLKYNKERQSSITQEILEVISGADALG